MRRLGSWQNRGVHQVALGAGVNGKAEEGGVGGSRIPTGEGQDD